MLDSVGSSAVEVWVDPPVDEAVREALAEALLHETGDAYGGRADPWRRAALEEGVSRAEDEPGYALSPRSTRGATRA
jgi:hypothetical protein